jgi:hypothetical protein
MSLMKGTGVYPLVGQILSERNWTAADLIKHLEAKGYNFDRKTIYRVTQARPMYRIDARILRALCETLLVDLGEVISLQMPKLQKLDDAADKRLTALMDKNTEGDLNESEKEELQTLGSLAQRLSLENARILAAHRKLNKHANLDEVLKDRVTVAFRPSPRRQRVLQPVSRNNKSS